MDSEQGSETETTPSVPGLFREFLAIAGQTLCPTSELRETQMRFVTCIVCERQLRLSEHVARFPDSDPAHQILSASESHEWRRPMGQPHASWLQQVDQHLKEMGIGQAFAWRMARWRPLQYRRKVDAATRCSGACSHT